MTECDNISACHTMEVIAEDANAMRCICTTCKGQYTVRKDWRGIPLNRQYAKLFKKDILQGNDNLLYKYHPHFLR